MHSEKSEMKLGVYEFYKEGHRYEVVAIALDTVHKEGERTLRDGTRHHMETVVYKALYEIDDLPQFGKFPYFTRTMESFTEMVEYDGKIVPKFTYVGPS